MIKQYRSWNQYQSDVERRMALERQYKSLSLQARIPGPQQAAIRAQMLQLRNALRQLPDSNKDAADFTPMLATYLNTPAQSASTWIRQVTFNPRMNNIRINRKYDCPANRTVLRLMMTSKSLGRYFNRHFRLRK